jgi:hypothetical protein
MLVATEKTADMARLEIDLHTGRASLWVWYAEHDIRK